MNYQKNCESLLKELSSIANLIFFVDGSVRADKLDHWKESSGKKYRNEIEIFNLVYKGVKVKEIPQNMSRNSEIPRISYHLKTVEVIAKKYGTLIKTVTQECDAEIAKYSNENKVLAVLAEDSDFLIFKGDWKLFSLNDLDIYNLSTKEYNKDAFWNFSGLTSTYEMAILATMAGNDLIKYDDTKKLPSKLLRKPHYYRYSLDEKFAVISTLVKNVLRDKNEEEVIKIVAKTINEKETQRLEPAIEKSIKMYDTVSAFNFLKNTFTC
jgi:hypothetical protein